MGKNRPAFWTVPLGLHTRTHMPTSYSKHKYLPREGRITAPFLHTPNCGGEGTFLQNRVWPVKKANMEAFFLLLTQKPRRKSEAGGMVGDFVLRKPKCASATQDAVVNVKPQAVQIKGKVCQWVRYIIFCPEGDL